MFRCPRCKSPDGYFPGEKCLHCGYKEKNRLVINRAVHEMQSDTAWARCPQCKSPDAYTPGEPCLHCRYVETDPQVIEYCRNAQLQIPRSAFLRCPRCKNPDAYTPGEKCLHCGYLERNRILVQRAKEFRYRIIPLMPSRDLTEMLKFRCSLGQLKKYRPVEGALLEYEYAFALLFSPKIRQVEALQNFYRVLARLGKALVKLLKNSRLSDHNRAVLTRLEQLNRNQFDALKEEFAKNNWALKKTLPGPSLPAAHPEKRLL